MTDKPKTIIITESHPMAAEHTQHSGGEHQEPWVVLVIDDDQGVLDVTGQVLSRFTFRGRGVVLKYAQSLTAAKKLYLQYPDAAVAMVDCAMEHDTSGLDFIEYVRNEQTNNAIQLVLRTGQPGFAPEHDVLVNYEINDYLSKTELTSKKLSYRLISYLRNYEVLIDYHRQNQLLTISNNKLEQLDKIKDSFLSIVSHEMRAPLRASTGLLEGILSARQSLSHDVIEELQLVSSCNQQMDMLIKDLIDTAMIKRNSFRMNVLDDVNLGALIHDTLPTLHLLANYIHPDAAVAIHHTIDDTLPLISIDPARIKQVIINLVNNALKFTETGRVTLSANYNDTTITLVVADTGMGMSAENIANIFGVFTQIKQENEKNTDGLGLGLPIVKKIIDQHQGTIHVESEVGQGSQFIICLPL